MFDAFLWHILGIFGARFGMFFVAFRCISKHFWYIFVAVFWSFLRDFLGHFLAHFWCTAGEFVVRFWHIFVAFLWHLLGHF